MTNIGTVILYLLGTSNKIVCNYNYFKKLIMLLPLSFIGVISSCVEYLYLKDSPQIVGRLTVFYSNGIYFTFQDITLQSKNYYIKC